MAATQQKHTTREAKEEARRQFHAAAVIKKIVRQIEADERTETRTRSCAAAVVEKMAKKLESDEHWNRYRKAHDMRLM